MTGEPTIADVLSRVVRITGNYQRADAELQGIMSNIQPTDTAKQRRGVVADVRNIIGPLGRIRAIEVSALVRLAYARGVHLVDRADKLTNYPLEPVTTLIASLTDNLVAAEKTVIRNVADSMRKMTLLSSALAVPDGRLATTLALTDRSGRRWGLSQYATMALRTVAHEALTEGTLAALKNHGLDIIQVSTQVGASAVCQSWDGEQFSVSGDHPRLPKLEAVPPFHPGCEHYLFYPGLT
jgi:hypothetical protein